MKDVIVKSLGKDMEKMLLARGVPAQDLPTRNTKFDVDDVLVKIEQEIPNVLARPIPVSKQYKALCSTLEHPLKGNGTLAISSFPSDQRAKHLAIHIMAAAILRCKRGESRPGRALPLWHRVYGGWTDQLRDKSKIEVPSLLVIVNVNTQSSAIKLEKVRDLLELYSEVPKIVVTGGEPPCNLFSSKLFYPLRSGIYLGPDNRVRHI